MKIIQLINASNAGSNFTSVQYDLGDLKDYAISVQFSSGTLNGTLTLQAANDTAETPITIPGSSQAIASGAGHLWTVSGSGYRYVNVVWTSTSGTGTLSSKLVAKETMLGK